MNRQRSITQLRQLVTHKRLDEARNLCIELTQTYPRDVEIWMMRGGMHFQLGEFDSVIECAQRIIAIDSRNASAYFSLGLALQSLKRAQEAETAYRAALGINPGYMKAFAQLTKLLMEQNRLVEARELLEVAITHTPQDGLLHYNLGLVLVRLGDGDAAFHAFETAIRINPRFSEAYFHLGVMYIGQNRYDAAVASLVRATSLDPRNPDIAHKLAQAYVESGSVTEAVRVYEQMITTNPVDADAHTCLGICRLLVGDFPGGWPEYEWRLRTQYMAVQPMGIPRWNGEPVVGRTVLLLAEQGFGDTVQFVRYAREFKARGAAMVILGCRSALGRLLAGCEGVDQVVYEGDQAPPFNVESTLLSLPGVLGTTLETIPATVPYLRVPPGVGTQAVAEIARHTGVLRVGLVWAGGIHTRNRHRNMAIKQFSNLLGIPGIKFFSLQKGEEAAQLADIGLELITDLAPHLGDFADTAAAVQELDLVISVDTAVAHVAGALARPVWTLLPFAPDWRWLLNRDDSPWYPTMRLFRQPTPGDWSSVVARVATELACVPRDI